MGAWMNFRDFTLVVVQKKRQFFLVDPKKLMKVTWEIPTVLIGLLRFLSLEFSIRR